MYRSHLFHRFLLAAMLAGIAFASTADAQMRTWKSSKGDYKVKAKLVSADKDAVKILTDDGRELTIALDKLSRGDLEFIKRNAKYRAEKAMKKLAADFYAAVRDKPNDVRKYLTAKGQENFDSQRSYFSMGAPDKGSKPRISKIRMHDDNKKATADFKIKIQGSQQKMQMLFSLDDDQWKVSGLVGFGPSIRIIMDFDQAKSRREPIRRK